MQFFWAIEKTYMHLGIDLEPKTFTKAFILPNTERGKI